MLCIQKKASSTVDASKTYAFCRIYKLPILDYSKLTPYVWLNIQLSGFVLDTWHAAYTHRVTLLTHPVMDSLITRMTLIKGLLANWNLPIIRIRMWEIYW